MRLLIAHGSEVLCNLITEAFADEFEVRGCRSGEAALELLNSFRPDALIMEFNLPYKDGITVLRQAAFRPKVILGLSNSAGAYLVKACYECGVSYLLTNPSVNAIRQRLWDLLQSVSGKTPSLEEQTAQMLRDLGLSPGWDGYKYLVIGITYHKRNKTLLVGKEVYAAVCEQYPDKNETLVERTIRHAIQKAHESRDDAVWSKYFKPDRAGEIPCPGNKKFISRLAEELKMPEEEKED